jgi:glycosyltransferase involved in cell wall biosynthesis
LKKVAVAIPCFNEAVTISKVVTDFRKILPEAAIHVFDNQSTDASAQLAKKAGAIVHLVRRQGKGHVMRAIFRKLDADAVVVVDGDDTYHAEDVQKLLSPIWDEGVDMVVGNRMPSADDSSMIRLHQFGNRLIVGVINMLFGTEYRDILSGYRAFSREFIQSIPVLTAGFEVETEITLQALADEANVVEVPISYRSRPQGSESKLRSFRDGYRIFLTAAILLRDHRPLRFFGLTGLFFGLIAGTAAVLRFLMYFGVVVLPETLITGLLLLAAPISVIFVGIGLILNAINTRFREMKQILFKRNTRNDD